MNRTDAKQIAKHIVTEVRKATYPYTSDNQFNANKAGSTTTTTQTFSAEMLSYNIDITFVSTSYNTVTWYGGSTGIGTDASIVLSDGRTQVITQGSATLTGTNMNYLYITWGSPIVVVTTSDTGSIGKNKILLATAQANPDQTSSALILPFGNRVPTLNATAISANTIIANMIKAGTITVDKLAFTPVTGAVLTPGSAAYDINTNSTLISWDRIETPEIDAGMIIGGTLGQKITVGSTGAVSISAGSTAVIMNNTGIVGLSHIGSSQVTEFSISATTGQAICGAGAVTLDTGGITVAVWDGSAVINSTGVILTGNDILQFNISGSRYGYIGSNYFEGINDFHMEALNGASLNLGTSSTFGISAGGAVGISSEGALTLGCGGGTTVNYYLQIPVGTNCYR